MQRKVAIWGLRFAKDGKVLGSIDSLYVSGVKSSDVLNLETGDFVLDNPEEENYNIVVKPKEGTKLSSANGAYTYISLLPGEYPEIVITVFVGKQRYNQTFTNVSFEEDKIYKTNVLKLEYPKQEPYVDVQNVKWATGNFIHYRNPNNIREEY